MPGSWGAGRALNSRRAATSVVAPRAETAARARAARRCLRAHDIVPAQAAARWAHTGDAPPRHAPARPPRDAPPPPTNQRRASRSPAPIRPRRLALGAILVRADPALAGGFAHVGEGCGPSGRPLSHRRTRHFGRLGRASQNTQAQSAARNPCARLEPAQSSDRMTGLCRCHRILARRSTNLTRRPLPSGTRQPEPVTYTLGSPDRP